MAAQNNSNYFSRLLQNKGPDYIDNGNLTDREVLRSIDIIINDIINGRIDYDKYGKYILLPEVFETLISHCRDKRSLYSSSLYCMDYTLFQIGLGHLPVVGPFMQLEQGMINQDLYNNIIYNRDKIQFELQKYGVLTDVLEAVNASKNVFDLVYATSKLKMYSRVGKK